MKAKNAPGTDVAAFRGTLRQVQRRAHWHGDRATSAASASTSSAAPPPPPPSGTETVFGTPTAPGVYDGTPWVLGMMFQSSRPGKITRCGSIWSAGETGRHTFRPWNNASRTGRWAHSDRIGIGTRLDPGTPLTPIRIHPDVSTRLPSRRAAIPGATIQHSPTHWDAGNNGSSLSYPANAGVFGTAL